MGDDILQSLKMAIVEGDEVKSAEDAAESLTSGIQPRVIVNDGIIAGIQRVGQLWQANEYFLPDVIMSAEASKAAMKVLEPYLRMGAGDPLTKRYVIGAVKGDMHDLGKNLVAVMLEAEGFQVFDLGVNVPTQTFLDTARQVNADIVGLGAYMSTTMHQVGEVITAFDQAGLRDRIKIMVGGAPTTQVFSDEVGADAWGMDALDTVNKAKALLGIA